MSPAPTDPRWARIRNALALVLPVALVLVVGCLCRGLLPPGTFNDDAAYALQAIEVMRHGNLLGDPSWARGGMALYPPGQALVLAPAAAWGLDAMRWEAMLVAALGVLACVRLARRYLPAGLALLVGLALFVNPTMPGLCSTFMSDVTFTTLCMLLLWLAEAPEETPGRAFGLGLLAGFTALVRLPGLVLVAMLAGRLALRRRVGLCAASLAGAAVPLLPYFIATAGGAASTYGRLAQTQHGAGALLALAEHAGLALANLPTLLGSVFLGIPPRGPAGGLATVAGLLLALLAAWGAVGVWKRDGWRPAVGFAGLYVAFFALWPYQDARFYLPLWPVLVMLAVQPARAGGMPAKAAALGVVLLLGASSWPTLLRESGDRLRTEPERIASFTWIRDHAPADAVVLTPTTYRVTLLAGRKAISPRVVLTPADLVAAACRNGAGWVHVDLMSDILHPLAGEALPSWPERPDLMLDDGRFARRAFAGAWGDRVYEITVEPGRFLAAYQHYQDGLTAASVGDAAQAEAALRRAVETLPTLLEARLALGRVRLAGNPDDREAMESVFAVARACPVLDEAVASAVGIMAGHGQGEQARRILDVEIRRAAEEGREGARRRLEQALASLPRGR